MKKLDRRAAWKFIKGEFADYTGADYTKNGLCHAIQLAADEGRISRPTLCHMARDIYTMKPTTPGPHNANWIYFWPLSKEGAKQRVKAINRLLKTIK